jgi:cytochrome c biogenesis protein CcmG/thiol:disulfide interchange protein DsbE
MRRWFVIAGSIAVVAAIGIGIAQSGGGSKADSGSLLTPRQANAKLAGASPRLAAIHAQASELLGGGKAAYNQRVRDLRGLPVVVNGWGAWCTACRQEMPIYNRVSAKLGKRVAFLGIDSQDNRDDAKKFLAKIPVFYPSYEDGDTKIVDSFGLAGLPATIFYDRSGTQFVHQGAYRSEGELITDIRRYAQTG